MLSVALPRPVFFLTNIFSVRRSTWLLRANAWTLPGDPRPPNLPKTPTGSARRRTSTSSGKERGHVPFRGVESQFLLPGLGLIRWMVLPIPPRHLSSCCTCGGTELKHARNTCRPIPMSQNTRRLPRFPAARSCTWLYPRFWLAYADESPSVPFSAVVCHLPG